MSKSIVPIKSTVEVWKDVLGYEGYYEVSNLGRVKSCERKVNSAKGTKGVRRVRERILKPAECREYLYVTISAFGKQKTRDIHVLVAEAFMGERPPKHNVNHLNGNKRDNRVVNLEICTASQNNVHAFKTGLAKVKTGADHHKAKLTHQEVLEIRNLLSQGKSNKELGVLFQVTSDCISKIKCGRAHKLNC